MAHTCSKVSLEVCYNLWDFYILEDDPNLIFFLSAAMLFTHKQKIMNTDVSLLPEILARLTIQNLNQLRVVIEKLNHSQDEPQ